MVRERSPYSFGSTAEKISQELNNENQLFIAKKKKHKQNKFYKVRLAALVVVVFACLAVVTVQYAEISRISYAVDDLGREYERLSNENTVMSVKIDSAMNLEVLRQKAKQELGMIKPSKNNIVYVNVPGDASSSDADANINMTADARTNTSASINATSANEVENIINQIGKLFGFVK